MTIYSRTSIQFFQPQDRIGIKLIGPYQKPTTSPRTPIGTEANWGKCQRSKTKMKTKSLLYKYYKLPPLIHSTHSDIHLTF